MSLQYWFRDPDGHISGPITQFDLNRVRLYTADFSSSAEEGSALTSQFTVDDPAGSFNIGGLRAFGVQETALGSNGFIYVGYTRERVIKRGVYRTEAAAQWDVTVVDVNTLLARRVMVGSDTNRPAETDVQRVQWLVSTAEGGLIRDTRYLSTANPVDMDAVDYHGQMFNQVLDDCAQQSGKNYYLTYFGDTATTYYPWGNYSLWYGDAGLAVYDSTIQLSNVLADVDSTTTFAVSNEDTKLTRDPSRVFSGVYVSYDGGNTYTESADTYNDFSRRDGTFRAENVKTVPKAQARAQRILNTIDTEEDVIRTSFQVPAAYVNHLREGMRVQAKFSHLPGYTAYSYMRVLNREVVQDSELTYRITVELSPTSDTTGGGGGGGGTASSALLYQPAMKSGSTVGEIQFGSTGDAPHGGCVTVPSYGQVSYQPGTGGVYLGFNALGAGTINYHFRTDCSITMSNETITATFSVYVGGVEVGSAIEMQTHGAFIGNHTFEQTVVGTAPVLNGDFIEARVTGVSSRRGVITWDVLPTGSGNCDFYFAITGSLS